MYVIHMEYSGIHMAYTSINGYTQAGMHKHTPAYTVGIHTYMYTQAYTQVYAGIHTNIHRYMQAYTQVYTGIHRHTLVQGYTGIQRSSIHR